MVIREPGRSIDAISIYFANATLARAFVARWCVRAKIEIAGGVFRVRAGEPAPRCIGHPNHATSGTKASDKPL